MRASLAVTPFPGRAVMIEASVGKDNISRSV